MEYPGVQHLKGGKISETSHTIGAARNAYRTARTMNLHNGQRSNFTLQYSSRVRGASENVTGRRSSLVFISR